MHFGKFWLGLFFLFTLHASASAQTRWATYANDRFGTTADYPADLFTRLDPPPDNSDGQRFRTADGHATLAIYGSYNVQNDTPASYLQNYANKDGISYRKVTKTFYVISGRRGDDIFYERCNFRGGDDYVIDCFTLTYPAAAKKTWDPIVTRISRSLHAGKGID